MVRKDYSKYIDDTPEGVLIAKLVKIHPLIDSITDAVNDLDLNDAIFDIFNDSDLSTQLMNLYELIDNGTYNKILDSIVKIKQDN